MSPNPVPPQSLRSFDLKSFWREIKDQNDGTKTNTFTTIFMPILRSKVAKAMSKSLQERHQLAFVVWEACREFWEHTRADPFPYGSVKRKQQHELGMPPSQAAAIFGSKINSHEGLGGFLREMGQTPHPEKLKLLKELCAKYARSGEDQQVLPVSAPSSSKSSSIVGEPAHGVDHEPLNVSNGSLEHLGTGSSPSPDKKSPRGSVENGRRKSASISKPASDSDSDSDDSSDSPGTGFVDRTDTFGPSSLADFDNWAVPVNGALSSKAIYREGPKLPTCGPWEIPLPRPLDPKLHIDPHLPCVQMLLGGIRIQTNQLPPILKVSLRASQRGEVLMDCSPGKDVESDLMATRWKAYRVLLGWAEHLKRHAKPPAQTPLSLLAFVRSKLRADGDYARDASMKRIQKCNEDGGVMFPGREYQMPPLPAGREFQPLSSTKNVTERTVSDQDQLETRHTPLSCRASQNVEEVTKYSASQKLSSDNFENTPTRVVRPQHFLFQGKERQGPENGSGVGWQKSLKRQLKETIEDDARVNTAPDSDAHKRARAEVEHESSASWLPIKRETSQGLEALVEERFG